MGSSCVPLRHWPLGILKDGPPVRILEDVFAAPAKWSKWQGRATSEFTDTKRAPVEAWNDAG